MAGSPIYQKRYKMKLMDFFARLGERRRHSRSYGNDEQRRMAGKGAISCIDFGETDY
jgi:hypothetical protein